ncbi:class A basic helix-loop-helix protein 15 isoform X1 [Motacilla alba alba]|uniref:class A basic helix-loop-helix protein 15 isoform X1 n=1 Tax=Motacilla alba alba TaxID=1094192 RepID=UPI0018D4E515|nr:class A basic helix-loop-helix protein 15 isoform X1 [Motacilla alba alba]
MSSKFSKRWQCCVCGPVSHGCCDNLQNRAETDLVLLQPGTLHLLRRRWAGPSSAGDSAVPASVSVTASPLQRCLPVPRVPRVTTPSSGRSRERGAVAVPGPSGVCGSLPPEGPELPPAGPAPAAKATCPGQRRACLRLPPPAGLGQRLPGAPRAGAGPGPSHAPADRACLAQRTRSVPSLLPPQPSLLFLASPGSLPRCPLGPRHLLSSGWSERLNRLGDHLLLCTMIKEKPLCFEACF